MSVCRPTKPVVYCKFDRQNVTTIKAPPAQALPVQQPPPIAQPQAPQAQQTQDHSAAWAAYYQQYYQQQQQVNTKKIYQFFLNLFFKYFVWTNFIK